LGTRKGKKFQEKDRRGGDLPLKREALTIKTEKRPPLVKGKSTLGSNQGLSKIKPAGDAREGDNWPVPGAEPGRGTQVLPAIK